LKELKDRENIERKCAEKKKKLPKEREE